MLAWNWTFLVLQQNPKFDKIKPGFQSFRRQEKLQGRNFFIVLWTQEQDPGVEHKLSF